jgi:hypothetical protein
VVSYFKYPEFYDEPPPLFSARAVDAAVEYLVALCEDSAMRRQAGEHGRQWVLERHDYRKSARMLLDEYEKYAMPPASSAVR